MLCVLILPALLQIAGTNRVQMTKQAIESLFKVRDISTSSDEADYHVRMQEIQTAFGSLLESCGVMELTKNETERKIFETKQELEGSLKVRITTACNLVDSSDLTTASHVPCHSPFDVILLKLARA